MTTDSVTLVTGDRVIVRRVAGKSLVDIDAGPGRKHIAFDTRVVRGEITVVPSDAMSLVTSGKLDARRWKKPSITSRRNMAHCS
ncbi:hypothetical protein [Pendulispora rubella]|uniref:hypothetical protein n=1 Tax=Pendulispora rubella TaxID=2741070 RepID=UPI0030E5A280